LTIPLQTEDPANARLLSQESYDFLGEFMAGWSPPLGLPLGAYRAQ
jgi:hypothetical protein